MKIRYLAIFAALCLFTVSAAAAQDDARITVKPQTISIGAFYNGTTVTATGSIPSDSEAVVRFVGAPTEFHMKQRGKVGGIVWMNLGSITFEGAPNVCIVSSAVDFKRLMTNGDASVNGLRLASLKGSIRINVEGGGNKNAFAEFIKLKQKEGLYREMFGNISYSIPSEGRKTFRANIPLPSRLTPGAYKVEVAAVRNGEIIARAEQPVRANLEGFPALLAGLAFGRPALYGILASLIALFAGLGIGLIFQSRGAH